MSLKLVTTTYPQAIVKYVNAESKTRRALSSEDRNDGNRILAGTSSITANYSIIHLPQVRWQYFYQRNFVPPISHLQTILNQKGFWKSLDQMHTFCVRQCPPVEEMIKWKKGEQQKMRGRMLK